MYCLGFVNTDFNCSLSVGVVYCLGFVNTDFNCSWSVGVMYCLGFVNTDYNCAWSYWYSQDPEEAVGDPGATLLGNAAPANLQAKETSKDNSQICGRWSQSSENEDKMSDQINLFSNSKLKT